MIHESIALLGFKAKDRVTGFSGVISTISFDLFGCVQAVIMPPVDDKGGVPDARWFDVNRLDVKKTSVMPVPDFDARSASPSGYEHGAAEKPAFSR